MLIFEELLIQTSIDLLICTFEKSVTISQNETLLKKLFSIFDRYKVS